MDDSAPVQGVDCPSNVLSRRRREWKRKPHASFFCAHKAGERRPPERSQAYQKTMPHGNYSLQKTQAFSLLYDIIRSRVIYLIDVAA
ncbi:hypothetical protein [Janthinobacterium sp.]|uniref:hypothetical protein n=1 Tax=Janthinobacterium sp. TaxID=1871054 RepID=UPI00293D7A8E|nr:hypothetical protein [Janthinobacterium sp.]